MENVVKIFHMADAHLDAPFSISSPSESEMRRIQLRGAFSSAVLYAKSEKVDIFLISGDFFDARFVTKDTVETVIREFASFPQCKFFISPGNHDPYNDASVYKNIVFPENVHIFSGSKEAVRISELGVAVYGVGFTGAEYISSPVVGYGKLDREQINILVCHGDIGGSKHGPVSVNEIASSGFDYIALGHIHKGTDVLKAGETYYAYPGCLQGRSYDETGHGGAFCGLVGKRNVQLEKKSFSKKHYEWIYCDISEAENKSHAVEILRGEIRKFDSDTSLRITLTGTVKTPIIILDKDFGESNALPYRIEIEDKTVLLPDFTAIEQENTLKGMFYKRVCSKIQFATGEEKKMLEEALKLGLASLDGRDIPFKM
jgi:DNA repair exonuclease SbcCD nuclease subunit